MADEGEGRHQTQQQNDNDPADSQAPRVDVESAAECASGVRCPRVVVDGPSQLRHRSLERSQRWHGPGQTDIACRKERLRLCSVDRPEPIELGEAGALFSLIDEWLHVMPFSFDSFHGRPRSGSVAAAVGSVGTHQDVAKLSAPDVTQVRDDASGDEHAGQPFVAQVRDVGIDHAHPVQFEATEADCEYRDDSEPGRELGSQSEARDGA
nr:hypothetical protein [uncultured Lichenicoccus sp.]